MKIKAFYSFDIYSPYVQIYNKRKRRNPTGIGLIFSILIFIISLLVIIYFIHKWKNNTNMTINYTKYTINDNTEYEINKLNLILESQYFNDSSYLTFMYSYFDTPKYFDIMPNDCNFETDTSFFQYKCFNLSNNYTLQSLFYNKTNQNEKNTKFLKVEMFECPYFYDYCKTPTEIYEKYFGQKININVVFNIPLIQHENRKNPIEISQLSQNLEFDYDYSTTYTINFNYLIYESDNGYFFQEKKYYYSIDFSHIDKIENKRDFLDYIGIIYFKLTNINGEKYVRNYKKIQELLSEIGGIISILNIIFYTIVNCLTLSYSNYEIFEDVIKPFVHKTNQHQSLKMNDLKFEESVERFNKVCTTFQKKPLSFITKSHILQKINDNNLFLNNTFNYSKKMNYCQIIKNKLCCNDEKNHIFNRADYLVRKFLSANTIIGNLIETEFYFEKQLNLKGVDNFIGTFFEKKEDKNNFTFKSPYKSTIKNGILNMDNQLDNQLDNQYHSEKLNIHEKS